MRINHEAGLGELLRHLTELVDQGAAQRYQEKALPYRPRYTPVMRVLAKGRCTVSEITHQLAITQGAVSQTLKLMESDGLIVRQPGPDARQSMVSLSDSGEKMVVSLQAHWRATFAAIAQLESEVDVPLRAVLKKTTAALEQTSFSRRIQQAEEPDFASTEPSYAVEKQHHFLTGGENYAHYRPTYPSDVVAYLRSLCPSNTLAIDVGCGSGQFSTLLAEYFSQVIATDISADQLAHASPLSNISYRCEPAEAIGVKDRSADLIVAAQAAHWFDVPRFYQEVRRVAKPGAIVALISYGVPNLEGPANGVLQKFYWRTLAPYWPTERQHVETGYLELPFAFEELSTPKFVIQRDWTLDALTGYLSTWSATRRAITGGDAEILNHFVREMRVLWGESDATRKITWPVNSRVGRCP